MAAAAIAAGLLPGQAVFAIAGSALLFPYYFGVLYVLQSTGYMIPGETRIAGISGGALTGALACAGYPAQDGLAYLVDAMQQHPRDMWAARPTVLRALGRLMPNGTAERCSGKLYVAASRLNVSSDNLDNSTSYIISRYRTNDDYFKAIAATSTISCAGYDVDHPTCAGPAFYVYRNMAFLDGAYANTLKTLCRALGEKYGGKNSKCVSISTYEPGVFRNYAPTVRSPANGTCPLRVRTPNLSGSWRLPTDCSALTASGSLPGFMDYFTMGSDPWPTIYPGCDPRNPIAFTRDEWQAMALDGTKAVPNLQLMYEYGMRDAQLWVQNQTKASGGTSGSSSSSSGTVSGGGRRRVLRRMA